MNEPQDTNPQTGERCDCLKSLRENLTKFHGSDSDVQLDLKTTINMKTMEMGASLPPLYYSYKKGKKRVKTYLMFNFCPFCRKPLK